MVRCPQDHVLLLRARQHAIIMQPQSFCQAKQRTNIYQYTMSHGAKRGQKYIVSLLGPLVTSLLVCHENRKLDVKIEHLSRTKQPNPAASMSKTCIHVWYQYVSIAYRRWIPSWRSSRWSGLCVEGKRSPKTGFPEEKDV